MRNKLDYNFIHQTVASIVDVENVYVFGSYARGNAKRNSDFDLLVIVKDNSSFGSYWSRLLCKAKILSALNSIHSEIGIDLLVYTSKEWAEISEESDNSFFRNISREKVLIA